MFAKRAHHRLPRPVGLPPIYLRASATTFDEVKPEAIAPPDGVTVAFVATLALASARPRACICATPRSQRDAALGLPEPGTTAATTGARLRGDVGRAEAAGRSHLGLLIHEARVGARQSRRPALAARRAPSATSALHGDGGDRRDDAWHDGRRYGASVPPCTMMRPCRSRRDKCDDGHRTQCQRDETKRPAKRKRLTHT